MDSDFVLVGALPGGPGGWWGVGRDGWVVSVFVFASQAFPKRSTKEAGASSRGSRMGQRACTQPKQPQG